MAEINLLSPIAQMPFGFEKGNPVWCLSVSTLTWIKRQDHTEATDETLSEAWELFLNEGKYAILQRPVASGGRTRLICIRNSYAECKAIIDYDKREFIYCISQKHANPVKSLKTA